MNCKYLSNGLALTYDHQITPCCVFDRKSWDHDLENRDLSTWHEHPAIKELQKELASGIFPSRCKKCEIVEKNNRGDSIRLNSERAYSHYTKDDIMLDIRPGNTCNFACQTCWPSASSRVNSYHKQAFGTDANKGKHYTDFTFLEPIAHRLRDIVVLGGEPFIDKSCIKFLEWLQEKQLDAGLTISTNGSVIDWDFINNYKGKLTIVVSLDAMGKVAEYIRQGTDWEIIEENFKRLCNTQHINTRVCITSSVYNVPFMGELVQWLAQDWPEVVSFAHAHEPYLSLTAIPKNLVEPIINDLQETIEIVKKSNIVVDQKQNAEGALSDIINRLRTHDFDKEKYTQFVNYKTKLDMVKNLYGEDYDPYFTNFTKKLLT